MSYENAKSTKLLATHCIACGKPLVDAISVEVGLGPVCRKRYGYNEGNPRSEESRDIANKAVHTIANGGDIAPNLEVIWAEGFTQLAVQLELQLKKRAKVRMVYSEALDQWHIYTPFIGDLQRKNIMGAVGRLNPERNLKGEKTGNWFWRCPAKGRKQAIWLAIQKCFPGLLATGPKGPFWIPSN